MRCSPLSRSNGAIRTTRSCRFAVPARARRQGRVSTPTRDLLVANLGTLGVVGAHPRMPTSAEFCFGMNSDVTLAGTAVAKVLADRLTRAGQQAARRRRSHRPSRRQLEPSDLFPDGHRPNGRLAASGSGRLSSSRPRCSESGGRVPRSSTALLLRDQRSHAVRAGCPLEEVRYRTLGATRRRKGA